VHVEAEKKAPPERSRADRKMDELMAVVEEENQHLQEDHEPQERRREPVTVSMMRGSCRCRATVPAKTGEREMEHLLVSKFG
jgi:hypothetical protein